MGTPDQIKRLVDTFTYKIDSLKSSNYNETQVRIEFIDPFFTALGWDLENKSGYAEAYKDVIHEFSLKTKDVTEAPDYCFRIGGTKKFFVEAKKPSVNLKDDIHPSFQLRRYAWTAKLPLSILTDFEEFAVYDCRILPKKTDKPSTGRVLFHHFTDYIDKWEEIESIFSREAVLKGSFDKYVESNKKKKGTAEVDEVFLEQMEEWRKSLAKNIALRNQSLSIHELNYAVQKTIDRIIFLRICEDRGIEDYGQLMTLQNGVNVYERLKQIFRRADEKYNSGLFHFEVERNRTEPPDELTLDLSIDDKSIKDIIKELYYPESPFEFSVFPADILGNVYEQFLGKVIRLTPSHHAVVEDKPEVKKAGGVYYTPTYIVDYIVKNTIGKLLTPPISSPLPKGRTKEGFSTPNEVSKINILDPACGSGSFLLGAFQYLLDWHLKYYLKELETNDKLLKQKQPPIYMNDRGEHLLATFEKKRILLNNIYGVDIDSQAVEVTKLSLMLKVLEGESAQTISSGLQFFRERALPDLSNNIKCGNSLIGPDFYDQPVTANPRFDGMEMQFLDDEEKMRINVFDWQKEFKEIMSKGGFDVVIGNPPYVFGRDWKELGISEDQKVYFNRIYKNSTYQKDMFSLFMEKASEICKIYGFIGQIVPNVWLTNNFSSTTRSYILNHADELKITLPQKNVFKNKTVDTVIYSYKKTRNRGVKFEISKLVSISDCHNFFLSVEEYLDGKKPISTTYNINIQAIIDKVFLYKMNLSDYCNVTRGVHPYRLGGYGITAFGTGCQKERDIKERPYHSKNFKKGYRPFIYGKDLKRFTIPKAKEYINYGKWLAEPRDTIFFEGERIYSRKILGDRLVVTLESDNSVADQQVYISKPTTEIASSKFLGALLGSKLIAFFIKNYFDEVNDAFPQIKIKQLKSIPVPDWTAIQKYEGLIAKMENLVTEILTSNDKLNFTKTPQEINVIRRQIEAIDNQIDQLVYQLYDLTEEEIKIVEGE